MSYEEVVMLRPISKKTSVKTETGILYFAFLTISDNRRSLRETILKEERPFIKPFL